METNTNKLIKLSENSDKEASNCQTDTFSNDSHTNKYLTGNIISIGHLKIYIRMQYPSLKEAGRAAGLSSGRVRQIITGKYLPKSPELIYQIAKGWRIDPIILTKIFDAGLNTQKLNLAERQEQENESERN